MRIRTNEILGNETVTAVEYRDNFNGLGLTESTVSVQFYPNPVTTELHVSTAELAQNFFIVDNSGRVWKQIPATSKEQVLDVSELASGSYSLVVVFTSGYTAQKFVK
ncbi:hypothetical protein D3C80_1762430 [compost metagenome]